MRELVKHKIDDAQESDDEHRETLTYKFFERGYREANEKDFKKPWDRSIGDTSAQDDAVQPRKAANSRSRIIANTNSQTHAYGNSVVPPNAFTTAPVPGDPFYYNPDLRDSDTSVGIDSDYLTSVVDHTRNHPTMEHGILANNRLDTIGPSFLCLAASSH
ncbi:hypothetical protein B2J93_7650 [Marssonina coronariae]|uniref:Uncharacterized protein n=1 Tax=Diplocarpon coronariae TaxID=2795749 RepID=A0A218ZBJ3_9HELO|nr:hypothetical protein B2J93_7650 [Marssonina coronariae]